MKIISGMHRSGTSLVARLFLEAGADLGETGTFYRPDKWNPGGYFEQPDIQSINISLVNGPFWKFAYFRLPSTKTIVIRAASISDQIHRIADKYCGKVVKDARFCLTLPAWLEHGVRIEKILVCLRDPVQVAKSLRKRNKITLKHAYNLWYIHNQRLLENSRNLPIWFIYYKNLLDSGSFFEEITPALQFFGISIAEEKLKLMGSTIVKPQINQDTDSQPDYPERVKSLWFDLLDRHSCQFGNIEMPLKNSAEDLCTKFGT